jgi:mannose/fructose/N-acetylgalactosamine-specific phosphotransferase system component IIB
MPLLVYRVDDRLVHGQVVIGWGKPLNLGFIVLVDDAVYAAEWERDLYRMGVPPEIELRFADLATALRMLPVWQADPRNGLLLTGDVQTMAALSQASPSIAQVNLGGLHHRAGRVARLPYIYLTPEEYGVLEGLERRGVEVTAQDLPTSEPVPLEALR